MASYLNEFFIAVTGIISSLVAWHLGGKQKLRSSGIDSITRGTDKIIGSAESLISMLEKAIEQEQKRNSECKDELNDLRLRVTILEKKLRSK